MATQVTPNSPKAWAPDVQGFVPGDQVPDSLFLQTATIAAHIEGDEPAVRVPYVADDGVAGFVPEGSTIPDAAQSFDEVVVRTGKVASLGKYSYETLAQPNAAQLVLDSLNRNIVRKADAAYLGNGTDPAGLLTLATDGGEVGANLDTLVDAIAGIEADGGQATHIIAAPDAWASLAKLKTDTTSASSLLGAGTQAAERMVLSTPVLVSPDMPAGGLLAVDKGAIVGAMTDVRLARSEDAFFSDDVIAIRVTWRLGWNVMRPTRVVKLTTIAGV